MTSNRAKSVLFSSKKKSLRDKLDWVERNCDQYEKEEVSQLLSSYSDFLLTFPDVGMMRCSHEVSCISDTPSVGDVRGMPRDKLRDHLDREKEMRKKLLNGLLTELEELEHVENEVLNQ